MSIFQRSDFKIKSRKGEDIEFHEVLLDSLAQKKDGEDFSGRKMETPLLRRILTGFFVFCLFLMSVLFLKTFQLQVIDGKEYRAMAEDNKFIFRQIKAERGVIYDQNLKQLVSNVPNFDLVASKSVLSEENVVKEVSAIIGRQFDEVMKEIEEAEIGQIVIAEDIPHNQLIVLEAKKEEFPGIEIVNNTSRNYIDGSSFSHLVGYTGKLTAEEYKESEDYLITDWIGRAGIEKYYEEALRKKPGELKIERDVYGNILSKEVDSLAESGDSLVLWLDSGLQQRIEEVLKQKLRDIGSKRAVGVAMDPNTGGILAMVSLPSYDNNLFNKGSDSEALQDLLNDSSGLKPMFNRVISGQYPTGSTIKPLVALAALEEEIIDPDKSIGCKGLIAVEHRYDPDIVYEFLDMHVHGSTDMRKAIAESCNVYFYTIGGGYQEQEGLGPTKIKEYLERFGWGEKTEIDLFNEKKGLLPSPEWKKEVKEENWWDGDTYHLSIGQGDILATPIQVVTAFAAVANGGTLFTPQIVKEIIDTSSESFEVIEKKEPKSIGYTLADTDNLQVIREGMRQAVTGYNSPQASAVYLNNLPVSAACKTGTAQSSKENMFHNWITIFAPYEDPEIVLTVMIEDVWGVQAVVLPVAKDILEWYFSRDNVAE